MTHIKHCYPSVQFGLVVLSSAFGNGFINYKRTNFKETFQVSSMMNYKLANNSKPNHFVHIAGYRLSEVEPRTNQVTSSKQWEVLVSFLEEHPTIATCTFITNHTQRVVARRLWNDISVVLNDLEAAYHSSEQWKRVPINAFSLE